MTVLPPGTILQLMYLKERLRLLRPGTFIEIGPGRGDVTDVLLRLGWRGRAVELAPPSADHLSQRFALEIASGQLTVENGSFLLAEEAVPADLVISCMVMEHFDDAEHQAFLAAAARSLTPAGLMIGIVPASPAHWGIEDEIAGHRRRYTRSSLESLASAAHWRVTHLAGLTFPISNLLLPISNALVARQERKKLRLSHVERTKQSGLRDVAFKTRFPSVLRLLLNDVMMLPLHLLQKRQLHSQKAMVLYFEALPDAKAPESK